MNPQDTEIQKRCRNLDNASRRYEEAKKIHEDRPSKHTLSYMVMRRDELDNLSELYNQYLEFTN